MAQKQTVMYNQSIICKNGHEIVLDRMESYDASVLNCYAFSKKMIKDKCDEKRLVELKNNGVFEGKNLMGKILMLCKEALKKRYCPSY